MYTNVKVINKDEHKNLKFKNLENLDFAAAVSHAPVVGGEFFAACKSQPILFINTEGQTMPCVLLGLKDGQNLFLDDKKRWRRTEYCPFIFKRYPFVYINIKDKLTLAFDADCKHSSETEGEPLFDENGEQSKFVASLLDMMNRYHLDSIASSAFCKKLEEMGLMTPFAMTLNAAGKKYKFEGFQRVDEKKFRELSDEDKLELIKLNYYDLVLAHLISLTNFEKLTLFSLEKEN